MARYVTASDLATMPIPDHEWTLPGFLPKPGMLIIFGEPRSGKSFLALQTAFSIAQGKTLLPASTPPKSHKVLYLYFDKTGVLVFQERLRSLKQHGHSIDGPVYFIHPTDKIPTANILEPACYKYFHDLIQEIDPDVVVFDVLREFHNGDENDSTAMKLMGDTLSLLCAGRSIVLVHHTKKLDYPGKTTAVRNIEAARGSSYIVGKADSTWLINGNKLCIESNFAPKSTYVLSRQASGFWNIA